MESMRVFIATLGTETNTFASFPTGLDDFKRGVWTADGIDSVPTSPWSAPVNVFRARSLKAGWDVVESLHTFAEPARTTTRLAFETMRARILGNAAKAWPLDAVLMFLLAAMA